MGEPKKKKPGRPKLPEDERRLASIGFRPTPALRNLLERGAAKNGRSLAQEINSRLEHSLDNADLPPSTFGGHDSVVLALMIGSIMRAVKGQAKARTLIDPSVLPAIEVGLYEFFRKLRDALPDTMTLDFENEQTKTSVGAALYAGEKAAHTFVEFAKRTYDVLRDPNAESIVPISADDIDELRALIEMRLERWSQAVDEETK